MKVLTSTHLVVTKRIDMSLLLLEGLIPNCVWQKQALRWKNLQVIPSSFLLGEKMLGCLFSSVIFPLNAYKSFRYSQCFERGPLSEMDHRDIITCFRFGQSRLLEAGFSEIAMTSINYLSYGRWKVVGTEAEFQGH